MLLIGAEMLSHLGRPPASKPSEADDTSRLILPRMTRVAEDLEEMKADVAWFRVLRKREIQNAGAKQSASDTQSPPPPRRSGRAEKRPHRMPPRAMRGAGMTTESRSRAMR